MKRRFITFTFFTATSSIILEVIVIIASTHSMLKFLTPSFNFAITIILAALITLLYSLYLGTNYKKNLSVRNLNIELSTSVNELKEAYLSARTQNTLETTKEASDDVYEIIRLSSGNPQSALLFLSAKIEDQIIVHLQQAGLQLQKKIYSFSQFS